MEAEEVWSGRGGEKGRSELEEERRGSGRRKGVERASGLQEIETGEGRAIAGIQHPRCSLIK